MTDAHQVEQIYPALSRIAKALSNDGIPKNHYDEVDGFHYRSIDDVMDKLAPLFARYQVCVVPKVRRRKHGFTPDGASRVSLEVDFQFISVRDASRQTVTTWGEGADDRDKGTSKAMASAFKNAVSFAFCIPNGAVRHPKPVSKRRKSLRSDEGWAPWAEEFMQLIDACASMDVLDALRSGAKLVLQSLQREEPHLFETVGARFERRIADLDCGEQPRFEQMGEV